MKTIKINLVLTLIALLAICPARANLTVTVQPGYSFGPGEVPTIDNLNLLGQPTIAVTGTIDGSTSLAAGSVNGILLADSVVDGVTIGYNGNVPRGMQVLGQGIAGRGLTNRTTTTVDLNPDVSIAFFQGVNGGVTNYQFGVNRTWQFNSIFQPWLVWIQSTNAPLYTNAFWGYTNVQPVTNIVVAGFPTPTLTTTDTVPVVAGNQNGSNTVMTLNALGQFVDGANQKLVSTVTISGTIHINDVVTAIALTDVDGQHSVMGTAYAVTATTNLTTAFMATNVAAAINSTPSTPKFTAVPIGSTILIYEPLVFYPRSGCTAQFNFTTATSMSLAAVSANKYALIGTFNAGTISAQVGAGFHAASIGFTAAVAGDVGPFTYSYSSGVMSDIAVTSPTTSVSGGSTATPTVTFGGTFGSSSAVTYYVTVTATSPLGNTYIGTATYTAYNP